MLRPQHPLSPSTRPSRARGQIGGARDQGRGRICTPEHRLAGVVPFQQGRNIMRQLGVLMTATQKRLLLALTAVTALATATPTTSPSTPVRGSFGESRVRGG